MVRGGTICSTVDGPVGPVITWTIYSVTDPLIVMGFKLNSKILQGCKKLGGENVTPAHEMPA